MAARRVGVAIGAALLALAFLPKLTALLIVIPPAVAAAYIVVLLGLLFVQGMQLVLRDGLDHRTAAVAGVSFWLGVAFQNGGVFPGLIEGGFAEVPLGNGMAAGMLVGVLTTAFIEATGPRRRRLRIPLDGEALDRLTEFLGAVATHQRWDRASGQRLAAAGEEALWVLGQQGDPGRELAVSARPGGRSTELEFATVLAGENIEDRLAYWTTSRPRPTASCGRAQLPRRPAVSRLVDEVAQVRQQRLLARLLRGLVPVHRALRLVPGLASGLPQLPHFPPQPRGTGTVHELVGLPHL